MTVRHSPLPSEIREFRAAHPKMRERDIAAELGIAEAALVAAECGLTAIRIDANANRFLNRAEALGEVMALTRNDSAVHEKIGVFEKVSTGPHTSIVFGSQIDLRVFPGPWAHAFAVTKTDGAEERLSLQFFDRAGVAVHKVHLRPASDRAAYRALVDDFRLDDQSQTFVSEATAVPISDGNAEPVDVAALRDRWSAMTDTHQFHSLLRALKLGRQQALRHVGADFAWQLPPDCIGEMLRGAADTTLPIMCFVGNPGIIQIHSGSVANIQPMGPWLNVMDPTFHLHLRIDHLAEVWAVRKPTADGHVTSLEALDAHGNMVIQFFGKRQEGVAERGEWRALMERLPRLETTVAA